MPLLWETVTGQQPVEVPTYKLKFVHKRLELVASARRYNESKTVIRSRRHVAHTNQTDNWPSDFVFIRWRGKHLACQL